MQSYEIRERFLKFFEKRGHAILPSASLVPENDPSVLFNTAGMQPLVPYLMGAKHPLGNRLASCQKCVRTGDLDDIGDNRHFSFFEMLGNWSLGDYFKDDAIKWSYEFLTSSSEGLGLDPSRLAVTIFAGDENAPYDQESKEIWMSLGIPEHRIYALPADDNWWSPGDNGPCGPCSEMFYDMRGEYIGTEISHDDFLNLIKEEKFIEIWNDVFMEYEKKDGKVIGKLAQKNVDTGAGLERLTAVMQGKDTAYDTDLFEDVMKEIKRISNSFNPLNENRYNETSARIISDHVRTSIFLILDGVLPSNKDQGYVLRRLLRRAIRHADKLGFVQGISTTRSNLSKIAETILNVYSGTEYSSELNQKSTFIFDEIEKEEQKFRKTLKDGLKEFEKRNIKVSVPALNLNIQTGENSTVGEVSSESYVSAETAFILATTYGFPIELTIEEAKERDMTVDLEGFNQKMKEHQKLSQSASAGMFKGGLGGTSDKIIRSHTAHHLLLAALRQVLGDHVHQRGSNITDERIRIDFAHDTKMTDEQKSTVEQLVNTWIAEDLPMQRVEMPREQAETIGAEMEFGVKYPDTVTVYFVGNDLEHAISKEFCGGPHIDHTGLIGGFKIIKEEASSNGVRRIKAVIE